MLTFEFNGAAGIMKEQEKLTSGMVGKQVRFLFSEEWKDLQKTAVYMAGKICRISTNLGEIDTIPHEVLAKSMQRLRVGVFGVSSDGNVVIPTVRAEGPVIEPGVDTSAVEGTEASLPVWAQMLNMIGQMDGLATDAKENLVASINEVLAVAENGSGVYVLADGETINDAPEDADVVIDPKGGADASVNCTVHPVKATSDMTQPVGVDANGNLWTVPASEEDGCAISPVEATSEMTQPVGVDANGNLWTVPAPEEDGCAISPVEATSEMTQPVGVDANGNLWTVPAPEGENGCTLSPVEATAEMTQPVGVDSEGNLWTAPGSGSGTESSRWVTLVDVTTTEDVHSLEYSFDREYKEVYVLFGTQLTADSTSSRYHTFYLNGKNVNEVTTFYNNNYRYVAFNVNYLGGVAFGSGGKEINGIVNSRTRVVTGSSVSYLSALFAETGASAFKISPNNADDNYLSGARLVIMGR